MKFRELFVDISTFNGESYGYRIEFKNGLNIVRGDNSSGKSTLVNSLIYALGMEEIIGSKGNTSLPYALKTKFDINGNEHRVLDSAVYLELENKNGDVITLKRAIQSKDLDTKLIHIIHGPYLSSSNTSTYKSQYTFVHDPGSAQSPEQGFFAFFERYLNLELPRLTDNKGRDTKLYLQSVFSALMVEQKRGWTDYIANIPYFGISGMREKVASFLLNLDIFRNTKKLNELQSRRKQIVNEWSNTVTELKLALTNKQLTITGINKTPAINFDPKLVQVGELYNGELLNLISVKTKLNQEFQVLCSPPPPEDNTPENILNSIQMTQDRIDELLALQYICNSQIKIDEAQQAQYRESLKSIEKDLKSNKLTQKLVDFGANEADLSIAKGKCHTCSQPVDDILTSPDSIAMPMSLEENIIHLENQRKMTSSLVIALEKEIERNREKLIRINRETIKFRRELISLNRDIKSTDSVRETVVRKKLNIENRINDISDIEQTTEDKLATLSALSSNYKITNGEIEKLQKYSFTSPDWKKIKLFTSTFKELASKFGYRSAEVDDIEVKPDTLLPYLKDIELREVEKTSEEVAALNLSADVKSDSSASDFVRLIWSYLISLYTTSIATGGNHPGIILFDEPAQHSMSTKSVNALMKTLIQSSGLQSIVAASFDESDENYSESMANIDVKNFKLERLPRKIINKLH